MAEQRTLGIRIELQVARLVVKVVWFPVIAPQQVWVVTSVDLSELHAVTPTCGVSSQVLGEAPTWVGQFQAKLVD
jgi:hypothetical protein